MITAEKNIIIDSSASFVVGLNVKCPRYFDFEIENDAQKLIQRMPSNLLSSSNDVDVIGGAYPVLIEAAGQPVVSRVYARGWTTGGGYANSIDDFTDIVLIMRA